MASSDELLPVEDATGEPSAADVQGLDELHDIRVQLEKQGDTLQLLATQNEDQGEGLTDNVVVLSDEQYTYFVRSMQMHNSIGLIVMLLLGILCGLSAWRAFVHSWGSHG